MRLVRIVLLHNVYITDERTFSKGMEAEAYRVYNTYGDRDIRIDEGEIRGYFIISDLDPNVYFVGVDDADEY